MAHKAHRWKHQDAIHDTLLVRLNPGFDQSHIDALAGGHGTRRGASVGVDGCFKLHVSEDSEALAKKLVDAGVARYADCDMRVHQCAIPNDTFFGSQTNLTNMDCPNAWNITKGSSSYPVAVIDEAFDSSHAEISSKIVSKWNTSNSNTTVDSGDNNTNDHGTGCAGVAGGVTNNSSLDAAVGWDTGLVLVASPVSESGWVAGLDWIRANSAARVVSISQAGTGAPGQASIDSFAAAWSANMIVVASAGNNGNNTPTYPSSYDNVIGVAGHSVTDYSRNSQSCYGSWCDIAAPWNTFAPKAGGGDHSFTGTSCAAPMVAAILALMISVDPTLTNSQLASILINNADPVGTGFTGGPTGRVNAYRCVDAARGARGVAACMGSGGF